MLVKNDKNGFMKSILLESIDIRIKEQPPLCHIFSLFSHKSPTFCRKSFVYNLMAEYRKKLNDKTFIGWLFFPSKYFAKQFSCLNLIPFNDWKTPKPRWLFVKVFFFCFNFFVKRQHATTLLFISIDSIFGQLSHPYDKM